MVCEHLTGSGSVIFVDENIPEGLAQKIAKRKLKVVTVEQLDVL